LFYQTIVLLHNVIGRADWSVLYNRCTDWLKFYLDLERPAVNERSVWNYELCGSLSMITRRHYSSFSNVVLELHSDVVQTNNTGFRGIFKFIPRCSYQHTFRGALLKITLPAWENTTSALSASFQKNARLVDRLGSGPRLLADRAYVVFTHAKNYCYKQSGIRK